MFRVLLATDGSDDALHAARFAAPLVAKQDEAEVIALYVKDLGPLIEEQVMRKHPLEMMAGVTQVQEGLERTAKSALEAVQKVIEAAGVRVQLRQAWGQPADVICETAKNENCDLIVMGHRGLGQVSGLILGSVSDRVVHRSRVPVLIVPRG